MTDILYWLSDRLQEPSTWAGISAAAVALHLSVDPGIVHSISLIGTGLGGVMSFVLKEKARR